MQCRGIVVAVIIFLRLGSVSADEPQAGSRDLARLLVRGVQNHEECLRELCGTLTQTIHRSPEAAAEKRGLGNAVGAIGGPETESAAMRIPRVNACAVRFWMSGSRYRYDAVSIVDGPNPWGLAFQDRDPWVLKDPNNRIPPRAVHFSDGEALHVYDNKLSCPDIGVVRPLSPQKGVAHVNPLRHVLLADIMAGVSFGDYLDFAFSGGGGPLLGKMSGIADISLEYLGTEVLDGRTCHRCQSKALTNAGSSFQNEYWVAPDVGYPIVRFVEKRFVPGRSSPTSGRVITAGGFRRLGPREDVWVPVHVEEQTFSSSGAGALFWRDTTTTDYTTLSRPDSLDPYALLGCFPLGCRIQDLIQGTTYMEGGPLLDPRHVLARPAPPVDAAFAALLQEHRAER